MLNNSNKSPKNVGNLQTGGLSEQQIQEDLNLNLPIDGRGLTPTPSVNLTPNNIKIQSNSSRKLDDNKKSAFRDQENQREH